MFQGRSYKKEEAPLISHIFTEDEPMSRKAQAKSTRSKLVEKITDVPPYTKEDLLHACLKYIKQAKGFQLPIDSLFLLLSVIRCYSRNYECVRRMILSLDYEWALQKIKEATISKDIAIGTKEGFMIYDLETSKLQELWKEYGEFKGNLQTYNEKMEALIQRRPVIFQDDENPEVI